MLKVAVVGLGDVSGIHLAAINGSSNAELVAVCDIDKERQSAACNVNFYSDYQKMLEKESLDCVHVCLPHYLHLPVTKACVEKKVNVYLEKPLTKNVDEGLALIELAKKHSDVKVCVSLQNRLNDSFVELKRIVDSGELGKVLGVKGLVVWHRPKSYYDVKPWRGIMKYAGG
ncbi:MAG: Gfo/Idh/MocA family oxidoreductase, partial [Bacillota bacterium]